jgi:hypothetical protein
VPINPQANQRGSMARASSSLDTNSGANVGPGIGSGTLGGVGPPTDGLDSNPYAEAPPRVRAAHGGQVNRSARTSRSGTVN